MLRPYQGRAIGPVRRRLSLEGAKRFGRPYHGFFSQGRIFQGQPAECRHLFGKRQGTEIVFGKGGQLGGAGRFGFRIHEAHGRIEVLVRSPILGSVGVGGEKYRRQVVKASDDSPGLARAGTIMLGEGSFPIWAVTDMKYIDFFKFRQYANDNLDTVGRWLKSRSADVYFGHHSLVELCVPVDVGVVAIGEYSAELNGLIRGKRGRLVISKKGR